jgi:hypothetical protein
VSRLRLLKQITTTRRPVTASPRAAWPTGDEELFLRVTAAAFSGSAYPKAIDNILVQIFYPEFPSFESPTKCR